VGGRPGSLATQSAAAGDRIVEITSSGENRRLRLHVPASYRSGTAMPLVINLHGAGANAAEQEALGGMSAKADQAGFIVAYPEAMGSPSVWRVGPSEGNRDVEFVRDVIDKLEAKLSVDAARVYVAGVSNGGGLASRLGCELSGRVAAFAGVSGAYLFSESCRATRGVAVVAFHGTADRIVPYEGMGRSLPPIKEWAAGWAERDGCGAGPNVSLRRDSVVGETWSRCRGGSAVVLYTIDGAGHGWPRGSGASARAGEIDATGVIWEFFKAHPLPSS
jgi:polyhydroxybutyrate depolymerase